MTPIQQFFFTALPRCLRSWPFAARGLCAPIVSILMAVPLYGQDLLAPHGDTNATIEQKQPTNDQQDQTNFIFDSPGGKSNPFDEPLVSDRPDFTESSSTVGRGVLQLEMGYMFVYNDDDGTGDKTYMHSTPEMLLRYGFLDNAELRIGWSYNWQEFAPLSGTRLTNDGGSDLSVGLKVDLFKQCGCWPEQAVLLDTASDSGATVFSSNTFTSGVSYLYSWDLANDWSLSANTGFTTDREMTDDFVIWFQSASLSIPITDRWSSFVEYFGLFETQKADAVDQHYMDGGITYLWNDNLQFDFSVGFGLNGDADDFFSGSGVSMRF